MQIDITKPISTMTADELTEARKQRLPIHCQTVCRRSRLNRDNWIYSDIEELSKENLDKNVAEMLRNGWKLSGTYFVRNAGKKLHCEYCKDTCVHPDDPTGQADCGYCGGSFAWRQKNEHQQQANDSFPV